MKRHKYAIALITVAFLQALSSFQADAKDNANQAKMDSLAVRLAQRLESGAFTFTPTRFTGSNNVCADFLDGQSNSISVVDDKIIIKLDFIGARITSMASTPHQRGRALATAAAAVHLNGMLPRYVNTIGRIEEKETSIGRKSKWVTLKIYYIVEETDLDSGSSTATADLSIDTVNLTARLSFYKMNLEGSFDGKIKLY